MATTGTWSDPEQCPFCGDEIDSPGVGFVDHVDEAPDCESEFETWRQRVTDDVAGCWGG
jgi:hypothetical protein